MKCHFRKSLAALLLTTALVAAPSPAHAMPAAIGAVAGFVSTPIGGIVASVGLSLVSNLLFKPKDEPPQARKQYGAQLGLQIGGTNPLSFPMGWTAVEGQRVYAGSWGKSGGTPNAYLTDVRLISDIGYADQLVPWVGDQKCTVDWEDATSDGRGYPITDFRRGGKDYAWLKVLDGTQTEADAFLRAKFGDHEERPFEADMLFRGQVVAIVTFRHNPKVWGNSLPPVLFETNGINQYNIALDTTAGGDGSHRIDDPDTWEPSSNPIVQAYNLTYGLFINGEWIYGGFNKKALALHRLPASTWIAAINACNVTVELAGGGSEPMYRSGGVIHCNRAVADYLERIYESCHVRFTEVGGLFKPRVGAPGTAVYAFTDASLVVTEAQTQDPFPPLEKRFNAVEASYPEPGERWNMRPAPGRYNADYEAEDGGRQLPRAVSYPMVPYGRQVQRLTKPIAGDDRRWRTYEMTFPPDAWPLEPGDTVSGTHAGFGFESKLFEVIKKVGRRNYSQRLTLIEIDPTDWDYDKDVDEVDAPVGALTSVLPPAQAIESFGATASYVADASGTARRPQITVSYDTDLDDVDGIQVQVVVKATGAIVLNQRYPLEEDGTTFVKSNALDALAGQTVEVSGTYYNNAGSRTFDTAGPVDVTLLDLRLTDADFATEVVALRDNLIDLERVWRERLQLLDAATAEQNIANSNSITAKFGQAAAAIIDERNLRASADSANATLTQGVLTALNTAFASSLIQFAASATPSGYDASISMQVRAGDEDAWADAGLYLWINEGAGEAFLDVSKFRVGNSSTNVIPFEIIDEVVHVTNLVVSGTLVVDGTLTTPKYAGDSISDAVDAMTAGNTSLNGGAGDKNLQSVTITTYGGRVCLRASVAAGQAGYYEAPLILGLRRDSDDLIFPVLWHTLHYNGSTFVGRSHQYFIDWEDDGADAGEHTYYLVGNSTTADFTVGGRYLSARENKTEDVS